MELAAVAPAACAALLMAAPSGFTMTTALPWSAEVVILSVVTVVALPVVLPAASFVTWVVTVVVFPLLSFDVVWVIVVLVPFSPAVVVVVVDGAVEELPDEDELPPEDEPPPPEDEPPPLIRSKITEIL